MMRASSSRCRGLIVLLSLLGTAAESSAFPVGDFRHDYLLPDERESFFHLYGFAGGSWVFGESDGPEGSDWKADITERAASGVWAAGALFGRLGYFAEGTYVYDAKELALGQARADLRLIGRALSVRGGRFLFPFGIEARSAPHRVNPFILRPLLRSAPAQGAAVLGELGGGVLNCAAAVSGGFPASLADTLFGAASGRNEQAAGGRVGLSPKPGIEIGGSFVEEGGRARARLLGVDFSVEGGPLYLAAEWGRLRREGEGEGEGEGGDRSADLAYARFAYRVIEYSDHFDAVEVLAGAELIDPDKERSGDRRVDYTGGILVSPRSWVVLKAEYRTIDREGDRTGRVLAEALLIW
ncbi:MAG: hypothetical protein ABIH26_01945 [Candidatus Eisenbacteria bacterium]